ncbi:MAG: hypothetical protein LBV47_04020 [Bacteroidales bacterium]|jgi:hypothetical protein|nr:hypothetical protein [Bacteroidales bacterium]
MKKTKIILSTIMLIILIMGCEKQNKDSENIPPAAADCEVYSFLDAIRIAKNNPEFYEKSYLIKGVVLDKIEYGVSVKLLEDLKGNFDKTGNSVFTVWGDCSAFVGIESNKLDNMSNYDKGDTLIMHIDHLYHDWSYLVSPGHVWLEKPEDYYTMTCAPSVVKLSDGYATGHILLEPEPVDKVFVEKLPIDEFENKLNEILNK